ncbi:MAG: NrfD/PsrC family molybdoenzyme membrane anchor subunit [Actinomycetota bacterium]|nr:NrfD/PsrC family molybdoenzyme membrane anchor subunit [Actinomycetota bacterium]
MAVEIEVQPGLPQGVGRLTTGWKAFIVIALAVLGFGLFAYWYQASNGMIVTNMRNTGTMGGATWGLYIVMVEFFIGVSFAGVIIAAIIRVFRIAELRPITRIAELLTVASLMVGLLAVVIDLGHPIRGIINMLLYVRPQSPFFGTFTLVAGGVLLTSLAYLYLGGRRDAARMANTPSRLQWFHRLWAAGYTGTEEEKDRHQRVMFWLSVGIVPLIVIALSTEGLVFGISVGRPGWFGSLQGPDFLVLAAASGLANLLVLTAIVRRALGDWNRIGVGVFKWLGRFLLAAASVALYFMIVELVTLLYATPANERQLADALLKGTYAWIFWLSLALMVGGIALLIVQAATRRWRIGPLVIASVAISTAAVAERYLTVVPSQTHATLLPYEAGSYFPNWVEFAVVAGLFALGALLIGLFMKVFPIISMRDEDEVTTDA